MIRVSSNFTLFFKIFVPVFYLVFYGAFTVALLLETRGETTDSGSWVEWTNLVAYMATIVIIYLTIWQLKRVEFAEDFLYITDYFKTYRYNWPSVKRISHLRFLFFTLVRVEFKQDGSFGRKVIFLKDAKAYEEFKSKHKEIMEALENK